MTATGRPASDAPTVQLTTDALSPRWRRGERVRLDPDRLPAPGDMVAVMGGGLDPVGGVLLRRERGRVVLATFSPAATMDLPLPAGAMVLAITGTASTSTGFPGEADGNKMRTARIGGTRQTGTAPASARISLRAPSGGASMDAQPPAGLPEIGPVATEALPLREIARRIADARGLSATNVLHDLWQAYWQARINPSDWLYPHPTFGFVNLHRGLILDLLVQRGLLHGSVPDSRSTPDQIRADVLWRLRDWIEAGSLDDIPALRDMSLSHDGFQAWASAEDAVALAEWQPPPPPEAMLRRLPQHRPYVQFSAAHSWLSGGWCLADSHTRRLHMVEMGRQSPRNPWRNHPMEFVPVLLAQDWGLSWPPRRAETLEHPEQNPSGPVEISDLQWIEDHLGWEAAEIRDNLCSALAEYRARRAQENAAWQRLTKACEAEGLTAFTIVDGGMRRISIPAEQWILAGADNRLPAPEDDIWFEVAALEAIFSPAERASERTPSPATGRIVDAEPDAPVLRLAPSVAPVDTGGAASIEPGDTASCAEASATEQPDTELASVPGDAMRSRMIAEIEREMKSRRYRPSRDELLQFGRDNGLGWARDPVYRVYKTLPGPLKRPRGDKIGFF